jgi:hypothetical protein
LLLSIKILGFNVHTNLPSDAFSQCRDFIAEILAFFVFVSLTETFNSNSASISHKNNNFESLPELALYSLFLYPLSFQPLMDFWWLQVFPCGISKEDGAQLC